MPPDARIHRPRPSSPPASPSPADPAGSNAATQTQAADSNEPGQTSHPPAVCIRNFDAYYGDFHVLKNIDLDIPEKRVTAFIGPSGCGKTTLLRWINRMNDTVEGAFARGSLTMHDLDVLSPKTDEVVLRRRVGMVFQKPNPFPKSIYDNVAFGPRLHMKLTKRQLDELVQWSLEKAALWNEVKDRLKTSALGLSGGQQQRLCIARAIAVGPEVLLMDEPASSLDPRSSAAIEDLILELRQDYTIAIITHNMQQAARSSDYTVLLYEGELVEYGSTTKIFTNPDQKRTEDYITGRFG